MSFRVGQKITCIDDTNYDRKNNETVPVKGRNYTVRSLYQTCVRLNEIVNPPHQYADGFMECSFKGSRFIPTKGKK